MDSLRIIFVFVFACSVAAQPCLQNCQSYPLEYDGRCFQVDNPPQGDRTHLANASCGNTATTLCALGCYARSLIEPLTKGLNINPLAYMPGNMSRIGPTVCRAPVKTWDYYPCWLATRHDAVTAELAHMEDTEARRERVTAWRLNTLGSTVSLLSRRIDSGIDRLSLMERKQALASASTTVATVASFLPAEFERLMRDLSFIAPDLDGGYNVSEETYNFRVLPSAQTRTKRSAVIRSSYEGSTFIDPITYENRTVPPYPVLVAMVTKLKERKEIHVNTTLSIVLPAVLLVIQTILCGLNLFVTLRPRVVRRKLEQVASSYLGDILLGYLKRVTEGPVDGTVIAAVTAGTAAQIAHIRKNNASFTLSVNYGVNAYHQGALGVQGIISGTTKKRDVIAHIGALEFNTVIEAFDTFKKLNTLNSVVQDTAASPPDYLNITGSPGETNSAEHVSYFHAYRPRYICERLAATMASVQATAPYFFIFWPNKDRWYTTQLGAYASLSPKELWISSAGTIQATLTLPLGRRDRDPPAKLDLALRAMNGPEHPEGCSCTRCNYSETVRSMTSTATTEWNEPDLQPEDLPPPPPPLGDDSMDHVPHPLTELPKETAMQGKLRSANIQLGLRPHRAVLSAIGRMIPKRKS